MNDNKYLSELLAFSDIRKKLLSALIGLVRAAIENELTTEKTHEVLIKTLSVLSYGDDVDCEKQLLAVYHEKKILAPDCITCPNPCGRTSDYPMKEFLSEDSALQALKAKMLLDIAKSPENPKDIDRIFKCLFMFGYEKSAAEFNDFLREAQ